MLQKIIANRIALLLVGVVGVIIGFVMLSQTGDVTCGRKVMKPGDACTTTKNGSKTTRTYAEQKRDDATSGYLAIGIGTLMIAAGAAGLVLHSRQTPAAAAR
jgi:hypothetical protein